LIATPALWVALEYARANLFFLALPWNLLGHSQYRYVPLLQISDVTGIYGVSFLLVMTNQFASHLLEHVAEWWRPSVSLGTFSATWKPQATMLVLVVTVTLSYGFVRLAAPDGRGHLRVAVVQANVLTRDRMSSQEQIEHLSAYDRLTREAAKERPDLIVWPSSSLPGPLESRVSSVIVRRAARDTGTYLLVGGAGGDKFTPARDGLLPYSNSELLVAPSGRVEGSTTRSA